MSQPWRRGNPRGGGRGSFSSTARGGHASISTSGMSRSTRDLSSRPPTSLEDDFERLSLVSRSSEGDQNQDQNLTVRDVQERFYQHILKQFGELDDVPKELQKQGHYDSVLAKLRKLREGVHASSTNDSFSITIYERSADLCLRTLNFPELVKSLFGLVSTYYPSAPSDVLLPRRGEFSSYAILYLVCYARPNGRLHGNPREVIETYRGFPDDVRRDERVVRAMRTFRALRTDVDFWTLATVWERADANERVFLECVRNLVQERTMVILSRAYLSLPETTLRELLAVKKGSGGQDDVMWTLLSKLVHPDPIDSRIIDGSVVFRKPKVKTVAVP
ncbi:hypothetical protein HKX48_007496 [Thoreauomyces humboldtii]|nr:hypothetical protein HKX48_007496 [Thoreauomyces humboldtii]